MRNIVSVSGLLLPWCLFATAAAANDLSSHHRPVHTFDQGQLTDWLLLGPIPRSLAFEDPAELLRDAAPNAEVALRNGESRQWRAWSADEHGTIRLGKFCKRQAIELGVDRRGVTPSRDAVVYATCRLQSDTQSNRRILLGADDGCRAWVDDKLVIDDVEQDWLRRYEHEFHVQFQDESAADLLLEIHNWTGTFTFACASGYKLRCRMLYRDGATPASGLLVGVDIGDKVQRVVSTDASGRFSIDPVPYAQVPVLEVGGRYITLGKDAAGAQASEISVEVARPRLPELTSRRLAAPPGRYTAITSTADDLVLTANSNDGSILVYDGRSFQLHPNRLLHNLTSAQVSHLAAGPSGSVWVATMGDGLYHVSSDRVHHWPASATGDRPTCLEIDHAGTVWASFDDDPRGRAFRIPPGSTTLEFVADRTLIFVEVERGSVISISKDGETSGLEGIWDHAPIACEGITSAAFDPREKQLWVAGSVLASVGMEKTSRSISWCNLDESKDKQEVYVGADGSVWALRGWGLYSLASGTPERIELPTESSLQIDVTVTRRGIVYAAVGAAGVFEVRRRTFKHYDHRDGLSTKRSRIVSADGGAIVISSDDTRPMELTENGLAPLDVTGLVSSPDKPGPFYRRLMIKGFADGGLIAFENLSEGSMLHLRSTIEPYTWRPDEGVWKRIIDTHWSDDPNVYFFCKRAGGRTFIGTSRGLVELHDDRFVETTLFEGKQLAITALHISEAGPIWGARRDGNILLDENGDLTEIEFDGPAPFTNCFFEIWGRVYAGTSSGLYVVDATTRIAKPVDDHPALARTTVVGAVLASKRDGVWIATKRSGLVCLAESGSVSFPVFQHSLSGVTINTIASDQAGHIWLSTDHGTLEYRPGAHRPSVDISQVQSSTKHSGGAHDRIDVESGTQVRLGLAIRDDADARSLLVRYRIGSGPWRDHTASEDIVFELKEPGEHQLDLYCIDPDFLSSETESVSFSVGLPFWRRPAVQSSIGAVVVGLFAAVAYLATAIRRTRRQRNQIRRSLLAQESKARQSSERARRERELLLARVSHDLRSPLSVVRVAADLLRREKTSNTDIIDLLEGSAQSMSYLNEQLLTYSQSTRQTTRSKRTVKVDVLLARQKAVALLRSRHRGVAVLVDIEPGAPASINVDAGALSEVLTNLVENSVRCTRSGSITLRYRHRPPATAVFEVEDTGCGMPADVQERIFDPFYQGTDDNNERQSGIGLGMYICHSLVEAMGGQITLASEEQVGTTVTVEIPGIEADATSSPPKATRRVFIVDDDENVRLAVEQLVSAYGHDVATADDSSPIGNILEFRPDVVLLDLSMPKRDGFEIASELRQLLPSAVKFVAVSGSDLLLSRAESHDAFDLAISKDGILSERSGLKSALE